MNVKCFTGRTSREAMTLVRGAFGHDAVILSTKPFPGGVEILAMAPESVAALERVAGTPAPPQLPAALHLTANPINSSLTQGSTTTSDPGQDAERLAMSTLSFQDYVRERMIRRQLSAAGRLEAVPEPAPQLAASLGQTAAKPTAEPGFEAPRSARRRKLKSAAREKQEGEIDGLGLDQRQIMNELRAMRSVLEDRLDALAFMGKLQRSPERSRMVHRLLDCGFSPALVRKLASGIPDDCRDEDERAARLLAHNLRTNLNGQGLEDVGGIYAMIGATGVGKTTSTAKLAAACAARYGAASLGLITLDSYRLGAHEQLRAYGRILGVPVHMAHDRTALEDLLELLSSKKMVIIDTVGLAQRASRTSELLELIEHPRINKLLVVNAASQGETIEDVVAAYHASACRGVVLSKIDEAVKLGPAVDALIRHRLEVLAVANGQRVPEDWHRLSSQALVHRALRHGSGSTFRLDASDVNLILTGPQADAAQPVHV